MKWLLMLLTGRRKSVREIPSIQVSRMARKWQAAGEWAPTHGADWLCRANIESENMQLDEDRWVPSNPLDMRDQWMKQPKT